MIQMKGGNVPGLKVREGKDKENGETVDISGFKLTFIKNLRLYFYNRVLTNYISEILAER